MRKMSFIFTILLFAILGGFISQSIQKSDSNKQDSIKEGNKKVVLFKSEDDTKLMPEDHARKSLDCKSCHECEYPTIKNLCLKPCPRSFISIYHSPEEAPDVITLTKLSDRYGKVVFSHKIHAQMAEMAGGCESCHHYNTTGPVLNCKNCHVPRKNRTDITVIDLEAAYHRQCMQCHRQWNRSTNCYSCHLPKDKEDRELKKLVERMKRTSHPELPRPSKIVYETVSDKGKFVTFFHDEHTMLFGISCKSCHKDENCARCHDVGKNEKNGNCAELHKKVHKSFDQHHQPCSSCHDTKKCDKCHKNVEMNPFNHAITTGWDLGRYHSQLACNKCHKNNSFTKLNNTCKTCHKDFTPEKFNHKITGLDLDDTHQEMDCETCHEENHFNLINSKCFECHDESLNPNILPGKKVKTNNKQKMK